MSVNLAEPAYVQDLEEHLRVMCFGAETAADAKAAVLLVRGALARGDLSKAAELLQSTQLLAQSRPWDSTAASAALQARGLVDRDPVTLDQVADLAPTQVTRAGAIEDAGLAWAARGEHDVAVQRLRQAHELYERLGSSESTARVRSELRRAGVRLHHWKRVTRPAFGWESLTETEEKITDLVAAGLSNRQVGTQVFLSSHTVAFHLRHIFWKLSVSSRVDLARLYAQRVMPDAM